MVPILTTKDDCSKDNSSPKVVLPAKIIDSHDISQRYAASANVLSFDAQEC